MYNLDLSLVLGLWPVPIPLPAQRRWWEGTRLVKCIIQEGLLSHLVVKLGGVLTLAQQPRVHVLVRLEHYHSDIDAALPAGACPHVITDLLGVRLVLGGKQGRLAFLARRNGLVKDGIEILHGERVEVQEDDAREVGLRPDVELGEQVAPAGEREDVAILVLGRVPGHEFKLAHNGALGSQDVALFFGDEGRDEDDDGMESGAGDWVPEQAVDKLLGGEEVRVVDGVVARREIGGKGVLACAVIVVRDVLCEGRDGEVGLAVLHQIFLEGEFELVKGRVSVI